MREPREDEAIVNGQIMAVAPRPDNVVPFYETVIIPREDRWNRPIVIPPGGGKAKAYTRATTLADTLEDKYNLTEWKLRQVTIGLSIRPDLVAKANSLGFQPLDDVAAIKKWKAEMNKIWQKAMDAAESDASANVGDALHGWTERHDRGETLRKIPKEYLPHLRAYEAATAELTAVHVERFLVLDDSEIGGTADRISRHTGYDKLIIVDLKSSKWIAGVQTPFGVGKICMQLAIYSRSMLYRPLVDTRPNVSYDADSYERKPVGEVDQERGLIIALNANTGKCELLWCDLTAGWRAVETALWVKAWRKQKGLFRPYHRDLVEEVHSRLADLISDAMTRDELKAIHDNAGKAWTESHAVLARQRWNQLPTLASLTTAGS